MANYRVLKVDEAIGTLFDVSTGVVHTDALGTGTANSATYLRGDQTWATPSGGGRVQGKLDAYMRGMALN